jgi:hypothetical protein
MDIAGFTFQDTVNKMQETLIGNSNYIYVGNANTCENFTFKHEFLFSC